MDMLNRLLIIILVPILSMHVRASDVLVIASPNVALLTHQQIKSLFSLQQKMLPNNQRVNLIHLPMSDETSFVFARHLFDFYPYQLQRLWDRQIYSGRAVSPKEMSDEKQVFEHIRSTLNTVGYVAAKSPLLEVYAKEVKIIGRL